MHSEIMLYGEVFGLSKPGESKHGEMSLPLNWFSTLWAWFESFL